MHRFRSPKTIWAAIALILLLGFPALLQAEDANRPLSYVLTVRIEPASGDLAVRATVNIPSRYSQNRELKFALHDTLTIKEILINGKKAAFLSQPAETHPFFVTFRKVVVSVPADVPLDNLRMDIEYGGRLMDLPEFGAVPGQKGLDDQINSRLVELAGYSAWYPQFVFGGEPIRLQMEVSLPQKWTAICSGEKLSEQVKEGRVITRWSSPKDLDPVIVASPNFREKSVRDSGIDVSIYHTQMPEKFIDGESRQISGVLKLFTGQLGETTIPGASVKHVYSPRRKGQGKAGFARPGMIVTSEGRTLDSLAADPNFSLFQPIAHEVAHFWWSFGVGQGDWINEAFAEYFSAVAVQKINSDAEFKAVLDDYRKQVAGLPATAPPLSEVPFMNDNVGFVVRYYKGALVLHRLREAMGDDKFFAASREFFQAYKGKTAATADFRNFWREKLGDRKELVDSLIDSKGGMPTDPSESRSDDRK